MFDILLKKLTKRVTKIVKIKDSPYFFGVLFLIGIVIVADVFIYFSEVPQENSINNIFDIIWWNVVTLTTVGYGDMYPTTITGKIATIIIMISGITTFAYILSGFVEYVIDLHNKKRQGLLRLKMENHIVICNWNERAEDLMEQLHCFEDVHHDIIVIDNALTEAPPSLKHYIKGNPSDLETLKRANADKAQKVIVLAKGEDKSYADANTVLTSLAVKNLNRKVYICAEVLDHENIVFLRHAGVDQIIDINLIVSRFIAQTTYNPKLLAVLNELVSNEKDSCEIYRVELPSSLQGLSFLDLFKHVKEKYDSLVIALEDSNTNKLILNPKPHETLKADYCFVIAEKQPVMID